MTQIDAELLISLIENRPIIWDKTLEKYKDKNLRDAAWREVCIILKEDFEGMEEKGRQIYAKIVVKKWNQIRDSWMRSLNAKKNTKKSGSAAANVREYYYHNQLMFFKKYIKPAITYDSTNNVTNETCREMNQDNTIIEESELETSINRNEQSEYETSIVNESPRQENSTGSARRIKRNYIPRQTFNAMDQKMMSFIDHQIKIQQASQNEDRNLSFFKGLLPTVGLLNDDQILQFQAGVISLLQNIKSGNQYPYQTSQYQSSSSTSTQYSPEIHYFHQSPAESTDSDLPDFTLV